MRERRRETCRPISLSYERSRMPLSLLLLRERSSWLVRSASVLVRDSSGVRALRFSPPSVM